MGSTDTDRGEGMITFSTEFEQEARIKVIGVGGGGGNAVDCIGLSK